MNPNQQPPVGPTGPTTGSIKDPNSDTFQTWIPTKNRPALLSYYFGVFCFIPFLGFPLTILAIMFGINGLKQYKQSPTPGAKGHAIAGIVLGLIFLLLNIVVIAISVLNI